MILSTRAAATVLGVAVAATLAGCSSSGGTPKSSAPPATHATTSSTSSSATPSASGTPADPATERAVSTAYSTFFSATSSVARSQAVLQHGSAFHQVLESESNSSQSNSVNVQVTGVNLLRSDVALVTYTLDAGGVKLPNARGYAVEEGGTWKVAARTFCNLLQLQNSAPAVCKDSSITALPH